MNSHALIGATPPPGARSAFVEQLTDWPVWREAWARVQCAGRTAGVDGVTVRAFRSRAEVQLRTLRESLLGGTYRPSALNRVQIPKPTGGIRVLGIPTVADRVVQTAAALVLHDRVTDLFSARSFAYRPFLGPRRAATYLRDRLTPGMWAVTADIEKFFDNAEHRIVAGHLRGAGIDEGGVRLILSWLSAPVQDRGRWFQPMKGLPQGSPLSPVLSNWYLTPFDTALEAEGYDHVRYADDFIVLTGSEAASRRALAFVTAFLERLKLRVKPAKTQMAPAVDGFTFVGFRFTPDTWTVPETSLDRFREAVRAALADEPITAAIKAHNDLIRGWRNYYLGNSGEMDEQLEQLDAWRSDACREYLARNGQSPDVTTIVFERLSEDPRSTGPSEGYSAIVEPQSREAGDRDEWHRHESAADDERGRFSTAKQLREAVVGAKQLPEITVDGWLRVPTYAAFVSKSKALVIVRRKKEVLFEAPLDDVRAMAVESEGVAISSTLIEECARRSIPVVLCRASGKPVARIMGARSPLDASVAVLQLRARFTRFGADLVIALLEAKLSNQRALLLYHSKYRERPARVRDALRAAADRIGEATRAIAAMKGTPLRSARQRLFLLEAQAAAWYWEAGAALVPSQYGFRQRVHRGAADVVNKALNYGYSHLLGRVWMAVHRAGLEPTLGLLHTGRRRSAGLVFDLMEPFRQPVVDRAILGLLGRRARLGLSSRGELSLRSRSLVQRAVARRLSHEATPGFRVISRSVVAFRRSLVNRQPYAAYRMTW